MNGRKRTAALALCLGLTAALLLSCAYMVMAAGHCCVGVHCGICDALARTEAVLKGFCFFAAALALMGLASLRPAPAPETGRPLPSRQTLVAWKVQMNN